MFSLLDGMRLKNLGLAGVLAGLSMFYPMNRVPLPPTYSASWMLPSQNQSFVRSARLAQETIDRFVRQENTLFTEHNLGSYALPEPCVLRYPSRPWERPELRLKYTLNSSSSL